MAIDLGKVIEDMEQELRSENSKFEPFIRHIRFPRYKNFEELEKIEISFPITAIIGENGTNKSSVIRAFYGAPSQKSLGDYWFESKVDAIKDKDESPSCFIYGYRCPLVNNNIVEVLKTRVRNGKNLDYWEPSRPILKYGMEKLEEKEYLTEEEKKWRSKTRWNTINKNVVYLDFRHEALSAYDRFFYCTCLDSITKIDTRQNFIRKYSAYIKQAADENRKDIQFKSKKILDNKVLDNKAVKRISDILDKRYAEIRIITHTFYTKEPANTIIVRLKDDNEADYSEAFAGSGEYSVICMVDAILRAAPKSLILLDEPEVSIHPRAQEKLMEFLFQETSAKKLQVIVATHSPYIIKDLPVGAIKLLRQNHKGRIFVKDDIYAAEAFLAVGASTCKLTVLVEDLCAKLVLEACLRNMDKIDYFNVCPVGMRYGAEGMLRHDAPTYFFAKSENVVYCLDGDQRKKYDEDSCELRKIVQSSKLTQEKVPSERINEIREDFIEYLKSTLVFLPDKYGPEEIVWGVVDDDLKTEVSIDLLAKDCFKKGIRDACQKHFNSCNSDSIADFIKYNAARILNPNYPTKFDEHLRELVEDLTCRFDKLPK